MLWWNNAWKVLEGRLVAAAGRKGEGEEGWGGNEKLWGRLVNSKLLT